MSRKSKKAHGQVRRSQLITTWGPGALIDLPRDAAIVGGLETWPRTDHLDELQEPRLVRYLQRTTGVPAPRLHAPPADRTDPREPKRGVRAWRFPEWYVVQEDDRKGKDGQGDGKSGEHERSRRLVHRRALDERGRFETRPVVPTRFVRACPRGHVDDLDWRGFVHRAPATPCRRQLWLDERGTSGDLVDLVVRCECGARRGLHEATMLEDRPLGTCRGLRPWLGLGSAEECNLPSRLLTRTAANAYFPQVLSVLSIPDRGSAVAKAIAELWDDLQIVDSLSELAFLKKKPRVAERLAPYPDDEVLEAIRQAKEGSADERPVKLVELDALLAAPEGYGDDVPVDPSFHARRLPDRVWRRLGFSDPIASVIQLHRLREVLALIGFTRFEAYTPDIQGEYDTDVERASLALDPTWFPAVENRGEGLFLEVRGDAIARWLQRPGVEKRLDALADGHERWRHDRRSKRPFPGGPYVMLHTLSHLLIQSLSMRCGYPASSIRERVYADAEAHRYGILLYTGSPDAEGTLGGLVQEARHVEEHLRHALRMAALCSNDPICAQHEPGGEIESRWLLGAACHGCALVAETSCEMRNDYLDRALVVSTLRDADAAFFGEPR